MLPQGSPAWHRELSVAHRRLTDLAFRYLAHARSSDGFACFCTARVLVQQWGPRAPTPALFERNLGVTFGPDE